MVLLDTNFLIAALKPDTPFSRQLRRWIGTGEDVGISAIAWAEFLCGPISPEEAAEVGELMPYPEPLIADDAVRGAELFNATGRRRRRLSDCLIAATCLRLGARLATDNLDDFKRFEPMGLRLVEPWAAS